MPGHLIIRADGDARIGTGHVMRCLALAAGWQSAGGTVSWLSAELTPALHDAIRSQSIDVAVLPVPAGSPADAAHTNSPQTPSVGRGTPPL